MTKAGSGVGLHDADDILAKVHDRSAGVPLKESSPHYSKNPDKWQRVCFRALLKKMNTEPDKHKVILSRCMVPTPGANEHDKKRVQTGYRQFIGTGDITSKKGKPESNFPKIDPKCVKVVLPKWFFPGIAAYKEGGAKRSQQLVSPENCDLYWECLKDLACTFELQVYPSIEAAVTV